MINTKIIYKILGSLLFIEVALMMTCLGVALVYDEDDDAFDDDKLTEESYRTTFEDPENLGLDDAEDVADEDY